MLVLLKCNGIKMYFFSGHLFVQSKRPANRTFVRRNGQLGRYFKPCDSKENHRKRGNVLLLYNFTISLQSYCGQIFISGAFF